MDKLSEKEFRSKRREQLLTYDIYEFNFDEMIEGFQIIRTSMSRNSGAKEGVLYRRAISFHQRAEDSLKFLLNCYSAGHDIEDLRKIYPTVFEYWIEYSLIWKVYIESEESSTKTVAALPLLDTTFAFANQLVCFAILLGRGEMLKQVPTIIDHNNSVRDGMLERMISSFSPDRDVPPDECARHLPYFKVLKIYSAALENRSALMKEYLEDWYHASRREGYYDSHKRGDLFTGYWSWEAAAITYLLDIDDSSYRNAKFYPADLVEYARSISAPRSKAVESDERELRVKSGQICPKSGAWETLDIPLKRHNFKVGDVMQAQDAAYGMTVWRYLGSQAGIAE